MPTFDDTVKYKEINEPDKEQKPGFGIGLAIGAITGFTLAIGLMYSENEEEKKDDFQGKSSM